MTDEQIIKALECCTLKESCIGCPFVDSIPKKYRGGYACAEEMRKSALDLINRLQDEREALISGQETLQKYIAEKNAEIKRLEFDNVHWNDWEVKCRAIKEFAERLKEKAEKHDCTYYLSQYSITAVATEHIDNLVKEMTEGDEGK